VFPLFKVYAGIGDVRPSDTPIYNSTGDIDGSNDGGAYHAMCDIADDGAHYNTASSIAEGEDAEENYQTANLPEEDVTP
jgi:hypothetical protein